MCRPASCRACGKATYAGCGQHVEQVLAGVPKSQRCTCAPGTRDPHGRSVLARLLGR